MIFGKADAQQFQNINIESRDEFNAAQDLKRYEQERDLLFYGPQIQGPLGLSHRLSIPKALAEANNGVLPTARQFEKEGVGRNWIRQQWSSRYENKPAKLDWQSAYAQMYSIAGAEAWDYPGEGSEYYVVPGIGYSRKGARKGVLQFNDNSYGMAEFARSDARVRDALERTGAPKRSDAEWKALSDRVYKGQATFQEQLEYGAWHQAMYWKEARSARGREPTHGEWLSKQTTDWKTKEPYIPHYMLGRLRLEEATALQAKIDEARKSKSK